MWFEPTGSVEDQGAENTVVAVVYEENNDFIPASISEEPKIFTASLP